MPNLTEIVQWEAGVYRIELTDPVEGGEDGIDNRQAKQLANRTAYLKDRLDTGQVAAIGALPAAAANLRSQLRIVQGGAGVPDAGYICVKKGDDTYDWLQIF